MSPVSPVSPDPGSGPAAPGEGRVNGTVELVDSVPDAFASLVRQELAEAGDDDRSLFLSGGGTAAACYRRLAELGGTVDWESVDVYWGDERCVPPDDVDSNYRLCREALLDRVPPARSVHPMYRSGPPDEAASAYQHLVAPLRSFGLVHLGMGPDGHCASLFPGAETLGIADPGTLVVATRDPLDHNPHDRITLTLPAIARARLVVFTVSGAAKHRAFAGILAGEDLPAARVDAAAVLWLVDREAAQGVPPRR